MVFSAITDEKNIDIESDERKKGRKHYFGRQVRKKKQHMLMGMNDFPPALSLVKGETF